MAIKIASGTTQFELVETDETYILDKSATLDVDNDDAIFISENVSNDVLDIRGEVNQTGDGFAAIRTDGENITIHIEASGSVTGDKGIYSEGFEPSSRLDITIDGMVDAGSNYAIETADSKETVINNGTILGKIYLGSGNDTFDNRNGKLDHNVEGGAGDDILIVDDAKNKLIENGGSEGFDTVKSEVSYTLSENVEKLVLLGKTNINGTGHDDESNLYGNNGKNTLSALAGNDILDGKKGDDTLDGGDGFDTFVFKTKYGHDTIMHFENGIDKIDVRKWSAIQNIDDVKDHLTASNGDLFVTVGHDVLQINDMTKGQLDETDFQF